MPTARQIGDTPQPRRIFHATQDYLLLDEVNTSNPFFAENESATWNEIVENLNAVPIFSTPLDVRACKKRVEVLVLEYRKENWRHMVRSGTEEQYGLIQQLLSNIARAIDDATQRANEKAAEKKEKKQRKDAALKAVDKIILREGNLTFRRNDPAAEDTVTNPELPEMTDEEMVRIGGLDPAELKRKETEDEWQEVSPTDPVGRKYKRRKDEDADELVRYLKGNDAQQQKVRELELKNQRHLRELELTQQKELKEKEIENQFLLEKQKLDLERYRIEMQAKQWEMEKESKAVEKKKFELLLLSMQKNNEKY